MEKSDYDIFPRHEADAFWIQDELIFQTGEAQETEEEFTDAFGTTHLIGSQKSAGRLDNLMLASDAFKFVGRLDKSVYRCCQMASRRESASSV
jgi:hypothetical protein